MMFSYYVLHIFIHNLVEAMEWKVISLWHIVTSVKKSSAEAEISKTSPFL